MTTIVTRAGKGSPLTHTEVDTNFTNLNTAKLEAGAIALGSAATPSISFTGDTNTGIYSPGADQVAISTGGTSRLHISSAGLVGIGANPSTVLDVNTSSGNSQLRISNGTYVGYVGIDSTYAGIDYASQSGGHRFRVGGSFTEAARIDTSGRLLVGTPTASGFISIAAQGSSNSTTGPAYLQLRRGALPSNTHSLGWIQFADNSSNVGAQIHSEASQNWTSGSAHGSSLVFSTTADGASSPTERMRIRSDGAILARNSAGDTLNLYNAASAGASNAFIYGLHSSASAYTGTTSFIVYTNGNVVNTNGSYTTISDAKLKENIVSAGSQWDDIKAIQIRNWNFKVETGHETHRQIGPIAQELETVCPGLVFETPDRDADGNETGEVTKSVNQSVLYMKAVKALQEAMERIEQLEAEMAEVKAQLS